jgi:exodeoxyribonuclease VIII
MSRLNWSTLRYIATSPKLLAWRVEHPQPESPALRLGRAIHCAVLEPEAFPARWVAATACAARTAKGESCRSLGSLYHAGAWYCRVRGHAPEGAGEAPEGIEVIAPEELDLVRVCAENVRTHRPAAKLLTGGHSEQEIEWTDPETGIECRGRVDYLRPADLVDLKSTRRETVREFERDAAANLYHGQLAWYHDGAIRCGRLPSDAGLPYVISVSTVEPYDVAAYRLSKATLEAGRILYRDLLQRYAQCQAASWWPGIAPDLAELDLPDWAPGMHGSEENGGDW